MNYETIMNYETLAKIITKQHLDDVLGALGLEFVTDGASQELLTIVWKHALRAITELRCNHDDMLLAKVSERACM